MHEPLFWASGARLPIVMVNVNRAMAAPWTIWCDQTDSVAQRDTGWLQFYCWSNQEIIDSVICAFKIAEELLLPCMVCYDGFFISHTYEPVNIPDQQTIDDFLPPRQAEIKLDTKNPQTFSGGTLPNYFMEFRYKIQQAFARAPEVITRVYEEYVQVCGRSYASIERYFADDADVLLLASGSAASTVYHTVRVLREQGRKVGLVRLRQLRPFPGKELRALIGAQQRLGVLDRNLSPGTGGVFTQEVRAGLHRAGCKTTVSEFVAGLGGRDITVENISEIFDLLENGTASPSSINWIGLHA
jgi:pyruvate/2-oxoacid:ferredoxin oxidoreductase alpha subunit